MVLYLPDKNQHFGRLLNCRYCADRALSLPGSALDNVLMYSNCSIHPNRFNFGRVIAERVNTIFPRRVFLSCLHLCVSVTKQYDLVPAKEQRCSAAGKVTAGLAKSNGSLTPGG